MSRATAGGVTRSELLLLLLDVDKDQPIQGRTRLAKLLFLIQKEIVETAKLGPEGEKFDFSADRYGPFSDEIFDEIEFLSDIHFITRTGEEDAETFKITQQGTDYVKQKIVPKIGERGIDEIKRLRRKYASLDLRELLRYVYARYPEYAVKSVIR
jgi:uncharacterized protein YwgA